jgi:replicative DNA helicase
MNAPITPTAIDAERAVLGGLLLDFSQVRVLGELLAPGDFFFEAHGRLFRLMLQAAAAGRVLDVLTVVDELADHDAELFGGVAYVASLPELCPSTLHLGHYADRIKEKAARRSYLALAQGVADRVMGGADVAEVSTYAEETVFRLSAASSSGDFEHIEATMTAEWARLEALHAAGGGITGLATGYADLDRQLAGLQPGELVILAARPAMGKTALAMNIGAHVALNNRRSVGVFSLEMSKGQLFMRMLCAEGGVNAQKARHGLLSRYDDWPRIEAASERFHRAPLWIDDTSSVSVSEMQGRARKLKLTHGLDLVIVDYLQLMGDAGSSTPREQQIAQVSRGLKSLARELKIPVLALSQLNRSVEARADKRPLLSDLRESGSIEQDADVVMFIYRDGYYNQDSPTPDEAEIIIAKQRNGPTGVVKLHWNAETTRFTSLDRRHA